MRSMKTVSVLPTVVTQPTAPSVLAFAFIRMRPDFSSFCGNSKSSRTSPFLSFLLELPTPASMDSVRTVSLITLKKLPPCLQNTLPSSPKAVIHPVAPSLKARTSTRITPAVSSRMGPCKTSTTSLAPSFLTSVPCARHLLSVRARSLTTTFMYVRRNRKNGSLVIVLVPSSPRWAKSLETSSSEMSMVSSLGATNFEQILTTSGTGASCTDSAGLA
mmetsp:Transcript_33857/g.71939  ORF Transcript_33857/g.71939 Transcript_33857/m.71939 type:complete len:217 (-) Transcript_33857:1314-1964(-)